jgi:HEAT repeat protein
MHIPSGRTRRDMDSAAELRAAGATWETIGEVLGRREFVLTRWARVYGDDWQRLLREAEERAVRQRSSESRAKLRAMLRHESSRVRLAAADNLVRQRLAEKATETPPDHRVELAALVEQVEQMTDAELNQFLTEFIAESRLNPAQGTAP